MEFRVFGERNKSCFFVFFSLGLARALFIAVCSCVRCVRVCVGVARARVIRVVRFGCVHGSQLYESPARKPRLTVYSALQVTRRACLEE